MYVTRGGRLYPSGGVGGLLPYPSQITPTASNRSDSSSPVGIEEVGVGFSKVGGVISPHLSLAASSASRTDDFVSNDESREVKHLPPDAVGRVFRRDLRPSRNPRQGIGSGAIHELRCVQ